VEYPQRKRLDLGLTDPTQGSPGGCPRGST
jgi:hypothetical protein